MNLQQITSRLIILAAVLTPGVSFGQQAQPEQQTPVIKSTVDEVVLARVEHGANMVVRDRAEVLAAHERLLAKRRSPNADHLPCDFLLLSIASSLPRAGVGGILLDTLSVSACKKREDRVGLYVNADNIGAINAYVKDGFRFICLIYDQYYMEKALP